MSPRTDDADAEAEAHANAEAEAEAEAEADVVRLARLSCALGLGDDPRRTIARIDALYMAVDQRVAAGAEGLDLPCKEGCDACCHESVFLAAPEFFRVAVSLMVSKSKEELSTLVAEMTRLAETFEDEFELLEEIAAGPERDEVAARVKFRCPLLLPGGRCSVYEVRELNARTFGQTWDRTRDVPFGCGLTHERLRVLDPVVGHARMFDARAAREMLLGAFPAAGPVRVYPWWFRKFASHFP